MITKERLEELIKQGATVWTDGYRGSHFKIKLTKHFVAKLGDSFDLYGYGCDYFGIPLNHIYETKEEAEWHREFGCIERTERLELPTWEDFWNSGQTIWFTGKDGGQYGLSQYNREILLNDTYIGYLDKESYYNACRKAKELFLGEKK